MKQKLRLGDSYALSKHKLKRTYIQYFGLLAVATTMCLYARAQRPDDSGPVPSGVIETTEGLVIGDSLPAWFWEVELRLAYDPTERYVYRFEEHKSKLLVLDFWGAFCSPCVASLDKWDDLQRLFPEDVAVVGIHLFYPDRLAKPFSEKRGWHLPIALDSPIDSVLNSLFYAQRRFGQVWIKDGKLLAIPKNKAVTEELVKAVIADSPIEIEMEESLTYFDPTLKQANHRTN